MFPRGVVLAGYVGISFWLTGIMLASTFLFFERQDVIAKWKTSLTVAGRPVLHLISYERMWASRCYLIILLVDTVLPRLLILSYYHGCAVIRIMFSVLLTILYYVSRWLFG